MRFSTLCTISMEFGPETLLTIAPFAATRQKLAYHAMMQNISEYPRPILTYFTGLVGVLVGMIYHIFVWRPSKDVAMATS